MSNKFTVTGVVLALVLGVVGLFVGNVTNPVVERTIERVGGQSDSFHKFFEAGVTVGGNSIATTTTKSTYTLVASEITDKSFLSITPNVELTLSLGATSTYAMIPRVGDTFKMKIKNASTTAASTITLAAADTSTDLQKNEDTAELAVLGLDWVELTFVRVAQTGAGHVAVFMSEFIEAD